jgi:hypothetical protein
MTAIHVDRYMFSIDEVVAAILPNVGRAREVELRIDADGYVVVDIVAPVDQQTTHPGGQREPTAEEVRESSPDTKADDEFPADGTGSERSHEQAEPGPREFDARRLCGVPLFRAFLEVKTEEAALRVLAERCHVKSLADLDRNRSNGMNLRHVTEEFEAWKIS